MGVDQAGHDDLTAGVAHFGAGGDRGGGGRADGEDPAALHDKDAVINGLSGDRDDARAGEGEGLFLRGGGAGGE